jgi:hypothetical protein
VRPETMAEDLAPDLLFRNGSRAPVPDGATSSLDRTRALDSVAQASSPRSRRCRADVFLECVLDQRLVRGSPRQHAAKRVERDALQVRSGLRSACNRSGEVAKSDLRGAR